MDLKRRLSGEPDDPLEKPLKKLRSDAPLDLPDLEIVNLEESNSSSGGNPTTESAADQPVVISLLDDDDDAMAIVEDAAGFNGLTGGESIPDQDLLTGSSSSVVVDQRGESIENNFIGNAADSRDKAPVAVQGRRVRKDQEVHLYGGVRNALILITVSVL